MISKALTRTARRASRHHAVDEADTFVSKGVLSFITGKDCSVFVLNISLFGGGATETLFPRRRM